MIRKWFFRRANYLNPEKYEQQYDNLLCQRENEEIARIINSNIDNDITIVDVGCGTGLGSQLIENPLRYLGIDENESLIRYCHKHRQGFFYWMDAESFVEGFKKLNPIFIFSLDYLNIRVIKKYLEKTDRIFIAIHYNKPYKSLTSVYSGRKLLFNIIHPFWKRKRIRAILEAYGASTTKLLGEDAYFVSIKK